MNERLVEGVTPPSLNDWDWLQHAPTTLSAGVSRYRIEQVPTQQIILYIYLFIEVQHLRKGDAF